MAKERERAEPMPWEELSDSGRDLIREIAFLLSERHTGHISIELFEGGVRDYSESKKKRPGDLGRRRRSA